MALLRIGLGLIFLANALTAWFSPEEFKDLVSSSFLTQHLSFISSSAFLLIIGISDSLLALIFLFNIKAVIKYALIWAVIWLVGVMLVIWEPIGIIEHLGYFAIALGLFMTL